MDTERYVTFDSKKNSPKTGAHFWVSTYLE